MKQTDFMWKCKKAFIPVIQSDNAVVRADLNDDVYMEHISAGTNTNISMYIKPDLEYDIPDSMFESIVNVYYDKNTTDAYKQLFNN